MPLNAKGEKILAAMAKTYGKKKALEVFHAMVNEGKLKDVETKKKKPKKKKSSAK